MERGHRYWKSISQGVEWVAKATGAISAIKFALSIAGQTPHYFLLKVMEAYAEIAYPPVDFTFGNIARWFGLELSDPIKDVIIFYGIFAGIFYRALSGSTLGVRHHWKDRMGFLGFGLIWPVGVFALFPLWVFAQVFPEDEEAFVWLTSGLVREAIIVVIIMVVACVGTAAGML